MCHCCSAEQCWQVFVCFMSSLIAYVCGCEVCGCEVCEYGVAVLFH